MRYLNSFFITGLIFVGILFIFGISFPIEEQRPGSPQGLDQKISSTEENLPEQNVQAIACPWVSDIMYERMVGAFVIEKEALEKIDDSFKWTRVEFKSDSPWEDNTFFSDSLSCIYEKRTPLPEYGPNYFGLESIQVTLKNDFFTKIRFDDQNDLWRRSINLHGTGSNVSCEISREACRFPLEEKTENSN